jgi:hypothetical protein
MTNEKTLITRTPPRAGGLDQLVNFEIIMAIALSFPIVRKGKRGSARRPDGARWGREYGPAPAGKRNSGGGNADKPFTL